MRWPVLLISLATLATCPASAREGENTTPPPTKLEDIRVPIPGYSPDVEANGCPARRAPQDPIPVNAYGASITFWHLIDHAAGPHSIRLTVDEPHEYEPKIAALDVDMRRLVLLHSLVNGITAQDGLTTYFRLSPAKAAPAVHEALQGAGLTLEATLFGEAMALFGTPYPIDDAERGKRYAPYGEDENAFENALFAIAEKFGTARQLKAKFTAWVERTPALWSRVEALRERMGAGARLRILSEALSTVIDPYGSARTLQWRIGVTPKNVRTLAVMDIFNMEFENGGVHQFFFNSSGAVAPDLPDALIEIGLPRHAEVIREALAMFPQPYPRDTEARRNGKIGQGWSEWDDKLSAFTDTLYAIDDTPTSTVLHGQTVITGGPGIRPAMLQHAIRHNMLPC